MIELRNITYVYPSALDEMRGLDGITLEIHPGESLALIGPNGSGKTTLARHLNALLIPTTGSVTIDGLDSRESTNWLAIRRLVGMVFQNPDNQIVSATLEREIAFGLENIGTPVAYMHQRVDAMLEKFDLQRYRKKSPHYLSGGEKQRLALAAVLAMNPRYLVLDEPTTLLDPRSRRSILQIVTELRDPTLNSDPISTILITQFPDEALSADRVVVLHNGRIWDQGKPADLFERVDDLIAIGLEPPVRFRLRKIARERGWLA
ncbi:ATP-binding cassette domain-containing protein [candidate division KSB1 bacterium]|nr:ATP-binding cassette domain-containing protein [candidate division KSB1 bacterium]